MDAEKLARKVSERLGTYKAKNYSDKQYGESEGRNMRWKMPRFIM